METGFNKTGQTLSCQANGGHGETMQYIWEFLLCMRVLVCVFES